MAECLPALKYNPNGSEDVLSRKREVDERLVARGLPQTRASNGRCLLLPARNVETWLYWPIAQRDGIPTSVDETTNYKVDGPPAGCARLRNEQCRPAGEYLHSLNHAAMPTGFPPLLGQGLGMLRDFLGAVRR